MAEHVLEHAGRLGAVRGEDPGRERIGHDEVPVAAELRLGQGAVRRLAVEQAGRDEEGAVAEPPLRGRDRAADAGLEPFREHLAAPRKLCVADVGPHAAHRPEALPDGCLRVQPEHLVGDVRRIALAAEQPRAARPDLTSELVDVAPQRRGRTLDVGAIPREPVVERRADEPLPHLPVRIRDVLAGQRGAQDRPRHAGVPELAHHLRDVDALRERELLVRVADAVAPGQEEVLDQQVAIGVVDARLRDGDLRALAQPPVPVRGDGAARAVVAPGVDGESPPSRIVDPGEVDRAPRAALDPVREHVPLHRPAAAEGERPPQLTHGRLQTQLDGLRRGAPRVDVEADEADERARLGCLRRERLLPVAHARGVGVGGRHDRLVAGGETRGPEAGETRAVAFAALRADEDRQPPAAHAFGDHLAAVGHVQRDRPGAAGTERLAERHVVDARLGQRPLAGRACVEQRRQQTPRRLVARPVGRLQQAVAPGVVVCAQRALDPARLTGRRARRRAGGALRGCAVGAAA